MDSLVKVWSLLWIGFLLWAAPTACKADKEVCLFCFAGSLFCLSVATATSRTLVPLETIERKRQVMNDELTDSALAWEATQQEEVIKRQYLLDLSPAPEPTAPAPENQLSDRQQLERSMEQTNSLIDALIDRERSKKTDSQPISYTAEQQLVIELSKEFGWISAKFAWQKRNALRKAGVDKIREVFQELANRGCGTVRGNGAGIEYRINSADCL
jgi:hypothetical protein